MEVIIKVPLRQRIEEEGVTHPPRVGSNRLVS